MSKYILKKDLPFAKAGDEIDIFLSADELVMIRKGECMGGLRVPYDQQDEWIEEVKDKRKWWEKLDTEIPKMRIRELVEKYPNEVQKEVMKHAARQMKEWYDDQYKIKSIPKVIRNTIDIARRNGKIIDSFYLSPILFNSFLDDVKNEIGDFNYQDAYFRGRCRFEGVNIEKKSDETDMSFAYKEPEKAKTEPKEEAGITKIDIPVNLPITENHLGGLAYLTMSMEGYERIILNGGYEFKFVKKEPKSDKKPREFNIILDSDGKATAISRPGAKAWDYFPSDKKAIWVKETIKVREVME